MSHNHFFAEIFEVNTHVIPKLNIYAIKLYKKGADDNAQIGRKLAYRFARELSGHWVWSENHIVTDANVTNENISQTLKQIRIKEPDIFKDVQNIVSTPDLNILPQIQADFVAQGLFWDYFKEITEVLKPDINLDNRSYVKRECDVRGWVINNKPTISISISSNVVFRDDLKKYLKTVTNIEEIIGLMVADKIPLENGKAYKGEIVSIVGLLDKDVDRQHLLDVAQKEGSKELITKAETGEYVVSVGKNELKYVSSALSIIISTEFYKRFKINTSKAQEAVWIKPSDRFELVDKIARIAKSHGLILDTISSENTTYFSDAKKIKYDATITLGNNHQVEYAEDSALMNTLSKYGLYNFISSKTLNIGIINASKLDSSLAQIKLQEQLIKLGFKKINFTVENINNPSRINFERAIKNLLNASQDLILAIIPDGEHEEDWGPYYDFKSLMMMNHIPSQFFDAKTLSNERALPYVMQNVSLGICAKLGNTPYILSNQVNYADMIVGIDISRKPKRGGSGTQNVAAVAQVYHQSGRFSLCHVIETPIEGETIPAPVWDSLFPLEEFENKKVIIHRDGFFRGNEMAIINKRIGELGGEAFFVEVIKSGSPRLYYSENSKIIAPPIGTVLRINDYEAILISSKSKTATPNPLHIKTYAPFTIGKALHSVLMLTIMHYGAVKRPRLPITIHYSDRIAYLVLHGVKPKGGISEDMYWL